MTKPHPGLELPSLWEYSAPLVAPVKRSLVQTMTQKDPSIVHAEGRWHLFMTVRNTERTAIEYCAFEDWGQAQASTRHVLNLGDRPKEAAPQVFFFRPLGLWFLIFQTKAGPEGMLQVGCSTTKTISDPASWSRTQILLDGGPGDPREEGGLDFWVICDEKRAYLFFTSMNGKLWRMGTPLAEFPLGFRDLRLALKGPFYEASHTYKLKGMKGFLTVVEEDHRRHYKAYLAETLDGVWTPLADTEERPYAGFRNIRPGPGVQAWTENISHGELLRDGCDETLVVDPQNPRFLFQGILESEKAGIPYAYWPWRVGLLTPVGGGR